jgi:8-oxo-dGTP diphosphatase
VSEPAPEIAVGGIVVRDGSLLLVQRGRGAAVGKWSIPGGRVQWGETLAAAVAREVFEETALRVTAGAFAGWVERTGNEPFPYHYVILDFFTTETDRSATAEPGDDAAALQWVPLGALDTVDLVDGLAAFLEGVGIGEGRV